MTWSPYEDNGESFKIALSRDWLSDHIDMRQKSAHERLPNLPGNSQIKRVRVVKLSFIETFAHIVNSKIIDTG